VLGSGQRYDHRSHRTDGGEQLVEDRIAGVGVDEDWLRACGSWVILAPARHNATASSKEIQLAMSVRYAGVRSLSASHSSRATAVAPPNAFTRAMSTAVIEQEKWLPTAVVAGADAGSIP
jgi:hypothetical protein